MGWTAADRHRLRRLPGLLDGPRLGGRGDQAAARPAQVDGRRDRGGGGALPLLPRRLRALHGARDLDGGAGRARLGHRAGVRRVHALPRRARLHRALDGAHPPLARPLRRAGTREHAPGRASCSTGSCRAASTRTCAPSRPAYVAGAGVDGIAIGGSLGQDEGADARGGRLVAAPGCPRAAAAPARDRRRGRHRARRGAPGSTASTARRPPAWPATAPRSCPTRTRRWRLDLREGASTRRAASRSTPAARARPAASTRAPTCTT